MCKLLPFLREKKKKGEPMLRDLKNRYVQWHIRQTRIPAFVPAEEIRMHVRFQGRVQKVGFRDEMAGLARRLDITGFAINLPDGSVMAELSGERDRIFFLLEAMCRLRRARVDDIVRKLRVAETE